MNIVAFLWAQRLETSTNACFSLSNGEMRNGSPEPAVPQFLMQQTWSTTTKESFAEKHTSKGSEAESHHLNRNYYTSRNSEFKACKKYPWFSFKVPNIVPAEISGDTILLYCNLTLMTENDMDHHCKFPPVLL